MPHFNRRDFLKTTSAFAASGLLTPLPNLFASAAAERAFKLCLNPGSIGVSADQQTLLDMAIRHGYEAMIAMPARLAAFSEGERAAFLDKMDAHGISWGSANLPIEFRQDEKQFKDGLAALPKAAQALEQVGATRMNTWILPSDPNLTYHQNFAQHAERLRACATIVGHHGIRLGLEYVGPKTMLTRDRYPFLRTMAEARELIAAIGAPNVGLVLDSFHWFCAEDTADDIRALHPSDIVTCDLNDARADLSREAQIDNTRELPTATGVIDLRTFLQALVDIGYDGPVRAEPFNQPLRDMEPEAALKATHNTMRQAFALVE